MRRDNVDDLPLPPRLKEYLLEPQYLFEDLISGGDADEEEEEVDEAGAPPPLRNTSSAATREGNIGIFVADEN